MGVLVESVSDDDLAIRDVNRPNLSLEEVNMAQHLTNGVNDMG
jgi:hypothetical protein